MCGICGYIDFSLKSSQQVLEKMVATLNHRGPDDYGVYVDQNNLVRIGLAQTRLAIIDLSSKGHQPMHIEHLTIVFNGEIYNYKEIKQELSTSGHQFNSDSDTEVILQAHKVWGNKAVQRFIGMFSYVIYDRIASKMSFYRDRVGVKPLYYYHSENLILFSSELKSFHQHPHFQKEIDKGALTLFFKQGYIPAPYSIFKNVHKLEAGNFLEIDLSVKKITKNSYWSVLDWSQYVSSSYAL
jgi:asparagine synthase (glutamine-hydrolysing)